MRINLDNIERIKTLADDLKRVTSCITLYDPRNCRTEIRIHHSYGSGRPVDVFATVPVTVLAELRAAEAGLREQLYTMGVDCGPRATNPWESRCEAVKRVRLEIQGDPLAAAYVDAIKADTVEEEGFAKFEQRFACSPEDFAIFKDFIKNGE